MTIERRLGKDIFRDDRLGFIDNADGTKKMKLQLSSISTENVRTLTIPDASGVLALENWVGAGYVPYSGASGPVDLGVHGLTTGTIQTGQITVTGGLSVALTGTISGETGSSIITGSGSAFTTELNRGDAIKILSGLPAGFEIFTVVSITSDGGLVVDSVVQDGISGTGYRDPNLLTLESGDSASMAHFDKSGNLYLGSLNADHTIFFYSAGSPTSKQFFWDESANRFQMNDLLQCVGLFSNGVISANADIRTNNAGADLYLGNATQASALFRAYANGNLEAEGITKLGSSSNYTQFDSNGSITQAGSAIASFNAITVDTPTLVVDAVNHRVGIGTASPDRQLEVTGSGTQSIEVESSSGIAQVISDAAAGFESRLVLQEAGVNKWFLVNDGDDSDKFKLKDGGLNTVLEVTDQGTVADFSFNAGLVFLKSDGNVGIGTTSPSARLNVEGGGITMGDESTEGETEEFKIFGFRTGDALRSLQIGVGVDAANTASFDGLSNYKFDGNIDSNRITATASSNQFTAKVDANNDFIISCVIEFVGGTTLTSKRGDINLVGPVTIGDGGATNYSKFESDGTLEFNGTATVFEDIVISLSAARVPAANAPTWAGFISNLNAYTYGLNDFQEFTSEIAHSYKEGSTIKFHVHGATNGLEGVDKTIKFEIEYELVDNQTSGAFGDVYTGTTTINGEITIPASTTDITAYVVDIGTDVTGDFLQGSTVKGRVRRIASSGTEPAADPFVIQVGIHIEQDTVGSRTELTK